MAKLREMDAIYAGLPHIDCGSCGRPPAGPCGGIVRGQGDETDCIFKLRERITALSGRYGPFPPSFPTPFTPREKEAGT